MELQVQKRYMSGAGARVSKCIIQVESIDEKTLSAVTGLSFFCTRLFIYVVKLFLLV